MKKDLYSSPKERSSLFGTNHVLQHETQRRYQGLENPPWRSTDVRRSNLDYYRSTFFNKKKTLLNQPELSFKSMPPTNPYFIPHREPLEIAAFDEQRIWAADKNAEMYERSILFGAKKNEAQHLHGRQAWIQSLTENVRGKDRFTQTLQRHEDSFHYQHNLTNQLPAVTRGF